MKTLKAIALTACFALAAPVAAEVDADAFLDPCVGNLKITEISPLTVYVDGFPATFDLTATVSWSGTGNISSLQPKLYFDGSATPIAGHNTSYPFAYSGGPPNDTGVATFPVTIPTEPTELPAFFSLEVKGNTANTDYECEQNFKVDIEMVQVEYKAPPAIANEYIKANLGRLTNSQRGCVISYIAEQHAKFSAYGPKGGPYNVGQVQDDVNALILGACAF
jgi:hypothetical protein